MLDTTDRTSITAKPWVRRVITWQLDGQQPKDLRLSWSVDPQARAALEEELFGKHVLITSREDWPAAEIIAGYRSQSEAGFSFRQLKDTHLVSFSPMYHWTEHSIRVHMFTCVLALQVAHLMRLRARQAGLEGVVDLLEGPTAIAFMEGDPIAGAKALMDAARRFPAIVVKGAVVEGRVLGAEQAQALATLESRELSMARVAGLLQAPLARIAYLLQAPVQRMAYALGERGRQEAAA